MKTMKTPIVDFIKEYKNKKPLRLHTLGHKGSVFSGCEPDDITEIDGADSLFSPCGIIAESEKNASRLFGCPTYYSTEGSSLCVRAMIFLLTQRLGRPARIIAGRNAHRSFISAAALNGADVIWLKPHGGDGYVSVTVTPEDIEAAGNADAVYITSPDYLGRMTDIKKISSVCRRLGLYLIVDCAHGAYLHFLPQPIDPMTAGADMCCTSAHKTLPALTGAAYLHVKGFTDREVREATSAFASTSPSYLILQSLDRLNLYLSSYKKKLAAFIRYADGAKRALCEKGYSLYGDEPLKITADANAYGHTGDEIARYLTERGIVPEYHDKRFITMMINPQTGKRGLDRIVSALSDLPARKAIVTDTSAPFLPDRVMSIRDAFFSQKEILPTQCCEGRIAGDVCISCPPAVSPVICGELIDRRVTDQLLDLGIVECSVVIPRRARSSREESREETDSSCT